MPRHLMKKRITVTRPSSTSDASAGISSTSTTLYSDIPASVQPVAADAKWMYHARDIMVSHQVYVDQELDLEADDVITYDGRTFIVTGIRDLIELGRVWEILCYEFKR